MTQRPPNSPIPRRQPRRNVMSEQRALPRTRRAIHHNELLTARRHKPPHRVPRLLLPRSTDPPKIPAPEIPEIIQRLQRLTTQPIPRNRPLLLRARSSRLLPPRLHPLSPRRVPQTPLTSPSSRITNPRHRRRRLDIQPTLTGGVILLPSRSRMHPPTVPHPRDNHVAWSQRCSGHFLTLSTGGISTNQPAGALGTPPVKHPPREAVTCCFTWSAARTGVELLEERHVFKRNRDV